MVAMANLEINKIVIITSKSTGYLCVIHGVSKSDAIHLPQNSVLDDDGYI